MRLVEVLNIFDGKIKIHWNSAKTHQVFSLLSFYLQYIGKCTHVIITGIPLKYKNNVFN